MEGAIFARLIAPTAPQQTMNHENKTSFSFDEKLGTLVIKSIFPKAFWESKQQKKLNLFLNFTTFY